MFKTEDILKNVAQCADRLIRCENDAELARENVKMAKLELKAAINMARGHVESQLTFTLPEGSK